MKTEEARKSKKPAPRVVATRVADENNVVHSIVGGKGDYCKTPCAECPWVKENTGSFPAEAFRISANTAEDMSTHVFSCHMRGSKAPATCAGFLLKGADDNLAVRLKRMKGEMREIKEGDRELHGSYKEMAIANGVDPKDPAIAACMPEARETRR